MKTILRRRRFHKKRERTPRTRVNQWIRISPIRLIDENGKNLGVVETNKALEMAREKGLDLIEIAPNVKPPVCRIMNFGRYKYKQAQQKKKQKAKQKIIKTKGIRIGLSTGEHDLETKARQAGKFIEQNHKVKIELILRGREKALMDKAREKLENFIQLIPQEIKFEQNISRQPRGLIVVVSKESGKTAK